MSVNYLANVPTVSGPILSEFSARLSEERNGVFNIVLTSSKMIFDSIGITNNESFYSLWLFGMDDCLREFFE